jgi:hypothetical protein
MRYEAGFQGHDSMREKAEREFRQYADHPTLPEGRVTKHVGRIEHLKRGGEAGKHHKHHGEYPGMAAHKKVKVHPLNKDQHDMHIPRHSKRTAHMAKGGCKAEGGEAMKRGGHHKKHHGRHHLNEGGMPFGVGAPMENGRFQERQVIPTMKRGGHHKQHHGRHHEEHEHHSRHKAHHYAKGGYAHGGDVYEHEMVGEHPSHAMHHFDYENIMRGTPKSQQHSPMRRGGHAHKKHHGHRMAAGGDDSSDVAPRAVPGMSHGGRRKMAMGGVGKYRHEEATENGTPIGRRRNAVRSGIPR